MTYNPYRNDSYAAEKAWDNIRESMYDREEEIKDFEEDEQEEGGEDGD